MTELDRPIEGGERELRFPVQSIGLLYLNESDSDQEWECYGEAQGLIRIPNRKCVRLDVTRAVTEEDRSFFISFGKQDIQILQFSGPQFTNDNMPPITTLTDLRRLRLISTKITDLNIIGLPSLPELIELNLAHSPINCEGLKPLRVTNKIEKLILFNNKISGYCLNYIGKMLSLRTLSLRLNDISDDGLGFLKELYNLRELDVSDTRISDNGLTHLAKLASLQKLYAERTSLSSSGLYFLTTVLPDCEVFQTNAS